MKKAKKNVKPISRRSFIGKATALSAFLIVPRYVLGKGYVAPSDKINLGFIGAGRLAINLQKNFLNAGEAQITVACDVYQAKVKNFINLVNTFYAENAGKAKYQSCTSAQSFMEILGREDIDAIVIATPDHWHAVQAIKAAEAGKDIYCEKPLSLTIQEGRSMVDATRKHERIFQTGNMQRSYPEFRHAVELIRNGYIGEIETIKVSVGDPPVPYNLPEETVVESLDWNRWLGPNSYQHFNHELNPALGDPLWARWRDFKEFGGGGMTDWGAHMFDIAQWALVMDDSGPREIIPPDGKDYPFLTYKYKNGVTMTHENFGKKNAVQFIGTEGQIEIQRGNLVTLPELLKDKEIGANEKHVYHSDNHYKNFLTAIKNRIQPICDVEVGHRTATVCNLGNIAYELKRPLNWNPQKEKFKGDKEANDLRSRTMRKEWAG